MFALFSIETEHPQLMHSPSITLEILLSRRVHMQYNAPRETLVGWWTDPWPATPDERNPTGYRIIRDRGFLYYLLVRVTVCTITEISIEYGPEHYPPSRCCPQESIPPLQSFEVHACRARMNSVKGHSRHQTNRQEREGNGGG